METRDLRDAAGDLVVDTDVCIVGTGPAGIAVALEVARSGARVVLLEGGGRSREPDTQALYDLESVGHPWGVEGAERRVRVLGGSSTAWSGRCATFSPMELRARSWILESGWPLSPDALAPHLERAAKLLGLGPLFDEDPDAAWDRFGVSPPTPRLDPGRLRTRLWQFSRNGEGGYVDAARDLMPRLDVHRKVNVYLHANVTRVLSSEGGRVTGVRAASLGGPQLWVRAPRVVLACGGLENARLLLASDDRRPEGLGNGHDLVGRYLQEHPSPVLGTFAPRDAERVLDRLGHYWLDGSGGRHVYAVGVGLPARVQERLGLPSAVAYVNAELREDAAWLSLRRLARADLGPSERAKEAWNVVRRPRELLGAVLRRARHRPEILPVRRLSMVCNPEPIPSPESRVTLARRRDALGVPLLRVDWRIDSRGRDASLAMLGALERELPRLGLPRLTPSDWTQDRADWRAAFVDHAHPMGTTRMASSPRRGVVDEDGQVHDVPGLFVAGASVFPTGGTAHPTLMIAALASRLGAHVRALVEAEVSPQVKSTERVAHVA